MLLMERSCFLAFCLQSTQVYHHRRRIAVLLFPHPATILQPIRQIGVNFLAVMQVVENRGVNLLEGQRWEAPSDGFRSLITVNVLVKHRLNADPMISYPNVIGCEEVEV